MAPHRSCSTSYRKLFWAWPFTAHSHFSHFTLPEAPSQHLQMPQTPISSMYTNYVPVASLNLSVSFSIRLALSTGTSLQEHSPALVPIGTGCYNNTSHCPNYLFFTHLLILLSHAVIIQGHPLCPDTEGLCQILRSWFCNFPPPRIFRHTHLFF